MSPAVAPQPTAWLSTPLFRWSLAIITAVIAGVILFEALNFPVFSRIGLPHEICYVQEPRLVWLHVISDGLIGVAYVSIAATLAYLVNRASKEIPFHSVFLAFGLFIVSCGFTHFMEVWVVWNPVYWLSGYVKVVTAAASLATAVALFPLVPRIFNLIASARESEERRVEIERLNEDLERFNYSVAHDLRAPVRSIVGFSDVLGEEHLTSLSPEARDYVERMRRSALRMDALVTGLLRYATVGRQQLELQPVDVDKAIQSALALVEQAVSERSAKVEVRGGIPPVTGDAMLLQVVFQNLISNAIKFVETGKTPEVEISGRVDDHHVVICVADNGVGFPVETRDRVFGMFERFHPEHPGTGIGLAIVQRAVERMQGEIKIESSDGSGTRFEIRLPRA